MMNIWLINDPVCMGCEKTDYTLRDIRQQKTSIKGRRIVPDQLVLLVHWLLNNHDETRILLNHLFPGA